ncbi:MAG: hypothetical protein ED556_02265 [Winogradskyella sp.]|uniref:hypothetical protein n=1 Tax=Winogradskyella sp. TaxID=1883156 RepID=UPI000F3BA345|nr:hypothetical protein [Winogradskyella sp.]RNC88033.1 MAG: hypothetical protein ED556_02265 [Winogradskyella sp.]
MKPTNTDNISCIVFGHNFYKPEDGKGDQLLCKNCSAKVTIDDHGDFNSSGATDKIFEVALRKLFLLKRKVA